MNALNGFHNLKQYVDCKQVIEVLSKLLLVLSQVLAFELHDNKVLLINLLLVFKSKYFDDVRTIYLIIKAINTLKPCEEHVLICQDPSRFVLLLLLESNVSAVAEVKGLVNNA
jgi:hypothetical protein